MLLKGDHQNPTLVIFGYVNESLPLTPQKIFLQTCTQHNSLGRAYGTSLAYLIRRQDNDQRGTPTGNGE